MFKFYRSGTMAGTGVVLLVLLFTEMSLRAEVVFYTEPEAEFGSLNQSSVGSNGSGGVNNYCAPTATMNSFQYLQNEYPNIYGKDASGNPVLEGGQGSWLNAAQLLASSTFMNTDPNGGTSEDGWVNGKLDYIETYAPGTTSFAGMDGDSTLARPSWDQNAYPTLNFLIDQLKSGEDIELGLDQSLLTSKGGHVVTLQGIVWNDVNNNGVFDIGDTLTLQVIDPANPNVITALTMYPGPPMSVEGGDYNGFLLTGALAESPITPLPPSVDMAMAGLVGLGGLTLARRARGRLRDLKIAG